MCRWNDWGKPCICVQQVKLFGKRCGGEGGRGERRIIACGIQCAGAIWGKVSLSSSKTRILQLSLWSSPAALQCTEAPHTLVELLLYYCWVIPSPPRCALDLARARNTYARGHSLTLMHTHTHTLSRSLSLSHAHTHSLSVSLSHALARTDFPAAFLVVPICEQLRCSTEWRQRPRQRNFFFHFDTKCEKELREIKYWSRSPEACSQNNNCLEMFLVGSCRRLKFFFSFEWKWSAPFPGLPVSNGLKLKLKFWKKKIKLKQKIKNSVGEVDRKKNCEREQKEVFSVNSGFRFPWDGQVWSDRSWALRLMDFLAEHYREAKVHQSTVGRTIRLVEVSAMLLLLPRPSSQILRFSKLEAILAEKFFFFAAAKIDSIMFILVLGHIVNFRKGLFEFRKNS